MNTNEQELQTRQTRETHEMGTVFSRLFACFAGHVFAFHSCLFVFIRG